MVGQPVAFRGTDRSQDGGIEALLRGAAGTILTDGRLSREPRIDPSEIIALLSERRAVPQAFVASLDLLREEIGKFIVSNLKTPQMGFGFNAKPSAPVEVTPIQEMVWKTHDKLDALYKNLQPTDPVAIGV
jgi:hypothetical protein